MLSPSFPNISFLFPSFYHGWYMRPTLSITICTNFFFLKSSEFSTVVSLSLSLTHTQIMHKHTHTEHGQREYHAPLACTHSVIGTTDSRAPISKRSATSSKHTEARPSQHALSGALSDDVDNRSLPTVGGENEIPTYGSSLHLLSPRTHSFFFSMSGLLLFSLSFIVPLFSFCSSTLLLS